MVSPCTPAPGGTCDVTGLCDIDALPEGLPCSGEAQCGLPIATCRDHLGAGVEALYVCTCARGAWACMDCYEDDALCVLAPEAGADAPSASDSDSDLDASPSSN
jgi:hypothetical protein